MEKLKLIVSSLLHNDSLRRVLHTFWQAAGGVLLAGLIASRSSTDVKLALAAAFAAGLAAVKVLITSKL